MCLCVRACVTCCVSTLCVCVYICGYVLCVACVCMGIYIVHVWVHAFAYNITRPGAWCFLIL